jgi:hypothetical protein
MSTNNLRVKEVIEALKEFDDHAYVQFVTHPKDQGAPYALFVNDIYDDGHMGPILGWDGMWPSYKAPWKKAAPKPRYTIEASTFWVMVKDSKAKSSHGDSLAEFSIERLGGGAARSAAESLIEKLEAQ